MLLCCAQKVSFTTNAVFVDKTSRLQRCTLKANLTDNPVNIQSALALSMLLLHTKDSIQACQCEFHVHGVGCQASF